MAVALPRRTHAPARFDPVHLRQVLDRTHGGLDRVKSRLVEVLAASRRTGGLLTVEAPPRSGGVEDVPSVLLVCPRDAPGAGTRPVPGRTRGDGQDVAGRGRRRGAGRTVRVTLGEDDTPRRIRGREDDAPGCILHGLREAGVRNPVFLLEAIDRAGPDLAEALRDVLDPVRGIAFEDQYLQVPFDLSAVLWIVTATDPEAIPEPVRNRLEVIELPGYTEQEKLAIAEQHLLKRPFDASVPGSAACLAPEPAAPSPAAGPDAVRDVPTVVAEREVSSPAELEVLSAGAPFFGAAAEAWRTAASAGVVRFERAAVREVIRGHTEEAGVTELNAKLARACRQALARGTCCTGRPAPPRRPTRNCASRSATHPWSRRTRPAGASAASATGCGRSSPRRRRSTRSAPAGGSPMPPRCWGPTTSACSCATGGRRIAATTDCTKPVSTICSNGASNSGKIIPTVPGPARCRPCCGPASTCATAATREN